MKSFSTVGRFDIPLHDQEDLIRELLAYDVQCPVCCPFAVDENGSMSLAAIPSPLHWSRQVEWPWIIENSDLKPWHEVLDVGGGWSVLKYALASRCRSVTSLEKDRDFIRRADESIRRLGFHNIRQLCGDVRDLSFCVDPSVVRPHGHIGGSGFQVGLPDESFDVVVCCSVLEHVESGHTTAIREMMRVLRPGGRLLLTLDVRYEGEANGDFYLDADSVGKLCVETGIPLPVPNVPNFGAMFPNSGTKIYLFLACVVKE